ncbi:ABC transporter substrate-binding protein [Pseudomonas syringae]|uniref:ABC transporter substrate-binding protein n=1 Tax=Pseudomonas syringae TaxID=317 RepID=UPI0015E1817A|nr:ABC transporter substrate-binding protein [Pseudomonas syringae]
MSFLTVRSCCIVLFSFILGPSAAWSSSEFNRVISLTWASTEDLLTLGITPLAIADTVGYRNWVGCPALPNSVIDVGSRTEPNLELVASLKPDLIIIDSELSRIKGVLSTIAPVLAVSGYNYERDALEVALVNFDAIAVKLHLKSFANNRKRSFSANLLTNKKLLSVRFNDALPQVTILRFMSPYIAAIFTQHSAPVVAAGLLGLPNGYLLEAVPWGISQIPVTQLRSIEHGYVIQILPFFDSSKLFDSEVWAVMPFVRAAHFESLQSTWTYGGLFSIYNLTDRITNILLEKSELSSDSPSSICLF